MEAKNKQIPAVSSKIQSNKSIIAQDSMLKKYCNGQLLGNLLRTLELNSMQCKESNQWLDGFIPMGVLPYLFFLINIALGFQEYIFLLHIMCRYQCDEAVTKNDTREVIWYHFTISYHFTKKGEIIRTRLEGRNVFRHIALKWQDFLQFCKRSQYLSRHELALDFFISVEFVKFIMASRQIRQSFFERFFPFAGWKVSFKVFHEIL